MSNNKTNTARKTYAEEGLEQLQSETPELKAAPADDGELKAVGNAGGRIDVYYRFTLPKKALLPGATPQHVMKPGDDLVGVYVGNFVGGKFEKPTFKIKLEDGRTAGISGSGQLDKNMLKVAEGAKVRIIYDGKNEIKSGKWEGSQAHSVRVFASKFKEEAGN